MCVGCGELYFSRTSGLYGSVKAELAVIYNILNSYFPSLQFSAASINLGGRISTKWHRDSRNLANGMCCVAVFGYFDPKKSAHLVAKEAKVVVGLARGDIIFFPSAVITHRNLALGVGEWRYSLVFYTAAGLFHWASKESRSKLFGKKSIFGWNMLMTLSELRRVC